ncbi:unnamed protein product, partial [Prorocentrum cordatum]
MLDQMNKAYQHNIHLCMQHIAKQQILKDEILRKKKRVVEVPNENVAKTKGIFEEPIEGDITQRAQHTMKCVEEELADDQDLDEETLAEFTTVRTKFVAKPQADASTFK